MQNEKIKSSVWRYVFKTDYVFHTIILVVLWDSWTSVCQDKWSSHAEEVQAISVHNERNKCLFLSLYANKTLRIVGNN